MDLELPTGFETAEHAHQADADAILSQDVAGDGLFVGLAGVQILALVFSDPSLSPLQAGWRTPDSGVSPPKSMFLLSEGQRVNIRTRGQNFFPGRFNNDYEDLMVAPQLG